MSWEVYCALSGIGTIPSIDQFVYEIQRITPDDIDYRRDPANFPIFSPSLLNRLRFSEADVAASRDIVLITPFTLNSDGTRDIPSGGTSDKPPTKATSANITVVFDLKPDEDLAGFYVLPSHITCKIIDNNVAGADPELNCVMLFSAYRILVSRFPEIETHRLWSLMTRGLSQSLNYNPISKAHDECTNWLRIIDEPEGFDIESYPDPEILEATLWIDMLSEAGKTEDEIVEEAWLGRGNMYTFVALDSFPIPETLSSPPLLEFTTEIPVAVSGLASLPLDIYHNICGTLLPPKSVLALASTNRAFRFLLYHHLDSFAFQFISLHQPYHLPVHSETCPRGDGELRQWNEEWKKGGIIQDSETNQLVGIPWLRYSQACSQSYSMRNRRRTWAIIDQVAEAARHGLAQKSNG